MRCIRVHGVLAALAASLLIGHGSALAASAEKGRKAFVQHGCWQCHGFEGQGSVASSGGKVIANTELAVDSFTSFVRNSNGSMPPYKPQILSDEDLADIHAYLVALPKPKSAKDIPLLSQ
jgi:ubiquinol-cytochrome c reductase cytochrome c subunit